MVPGTPWGKTGSRAAPCSHSPDITGSREPGALSFPTCPLPPFEPSLGLSALFPEAKYINSILHTLKATQNRGSLPWYIRKNIKDIGCCHLLKISELVLHSCSAIDSNKRLTAAINWSTNNMGLMKCREIPSLCHALPSRLQCSICWIFSTWIRKKSCGTVLYTGAGWWWTGYLSFSNLKTRAHISSF